MSDDTERRIHDLEQALKLTEEDINAAMTGPITRGKFAVLRAALHRNRTVLNSEWRTPDAEYRQDGESQSHPATVVREHDPRVP
jgi:hypothetical protein